MTNGIAVFLLTVAMLVTVAMMLAYRVARFDECRTVHPIWYCVGEK
jgi:hypothetical protein